MTGSYGFRVLSAGIPLVNPMIRDFEPERFTKSTILRNFSSIAIFREFKAAIDPDPEQWIGLHPGEDFDLR